MYNNIFDTHAHYDDERFSDDLDELLSLQPKKGIVNIVNCATDISSCRKLSEISDNYGYIYFSAGIHPHESENTSDTFINDLISFTQHKKCVAIGEIGLDYHYDFSPRDKQKYVFEQQLMLAKDLNLPVIIHDREAHCDTLALLEKYTPKGIVHCFSGSAEMAQQVIKLGMYIGLGGAVTFSNAKKPVEVAKSIPLDRLVLETDCPYMAPVPHRGKRNESSLIAHTAEFIASLRGIDTQELINIATENSKNIFGI